MSIACGITILECARWVWKRCLHNAGHDSETWGLASVDEFKPIPRLCRCILANCQDDFEDPCLGLPGGCPVDPTSVVRRKKYRDTCGRAPPYLIYLDHQRSDVVLAVRGLNLDNSLGKRKFDGGYVHNGLLKAAAWVLDAECDVLRELMEKYPNYTLTFAGHSLGSGVAAMLALVIVLNRDKLGNIERKRIRCFAIAPARCMSLNLAVRYADIINSVVSIWLLDMQILSTLLCSRQDRFGLLFNSLYVVG